MGSRAEGSSLHEIELQVRNELGVEERDVLLVSVGRLATQKGLATLIRGAAEDSQRAV